MNISITRARTLTTEKEFEWVKLSRSPRRMKISMEELSSAVRTVRSLRNKYRELEAREKREKKKSLRRGILRVLLGRAKKSRTTQKKELFEDTLVRLSGTSQKRRVKTDPTRSLGDSGAKSLRSANTSAFFRSNSHA